MTIWTPDLEGRTGPRYQAIADAVADDVVRGILTEGDRLPPHRELAFALGVTVGTVTRAYKEAERRGLVTGEVGRGTFVRGAGEGPGKMVRSPLVVPETQVPGVVDLGRNFTPDAGLDAVMAETLGRLSRERGLSTLMTYQPAAGMERHREAGARWMAGAGFDADSARTLITVGAQHAITVALMTLTRPGDTVMTEALTYPGALTLAAMHGVKLQGLAMDEEGLLPDALEAACRSGTSKVLYVAPTYHNPTGAVMSADRRQAIAKVLEDHGITAIEDDIFGRQRTDLPPPLAALAQDRVCYVNGFKFLAPGLRAGFLHAPGALVPRLMAVMRTTLWMAPLLPAEIATRWIEDGTAERLAAWHRREAAARQELFRAAMGEFDVHLEEGAYHAWLRLPEPWRPDPFAAAAEERGVLVMPSTTFVVGHAPVPSALRLSLGCPPTREELEKGLAILAGLLREPPPAAAPVV